MTATPLDGPAASAPPARLRTLHVVVLVVCTLVAFLDGFDVQMISFLAPAIAREWQAPKEVFGLIFSSGIAGMLVGMVGQGPFSDRFGRKPMVLFCVATFGLCTLACAFAQSPAQLIVVRFLGGLGMGAVMPNVIVLVAEIAPPQLRSRMVVLLGAGVPVGGLSAGALSAWLLPLVGWREIFIAGGVAPLLLTPVLALWMPESPMFRLERARRRSGDRRLADERRVQALVQRGWVAPEPAAATGTTTPGVKALFDGASRRNTLLIWLIFAANMMLFYSVLSWMPLILTSTGTPEGLAALSGAMLNLGAVAGSLPLAWAADRFGVKRVIPLAFVAGGVLFCATGALLGVSYPALLMLCTVLGAISGGGQLLLNAVVSGLYPTAVRATGFGFAGMAGRAGAIAGPLACGAMLALGVSEAGLLALLAAPALVAALAATRLRTAGSAQSA
ncbi:MFS transporter [Phenylobacterium sp.]|uniref:MFS transporter n=1 Tax=Phenylobacterium sp. TaxID=1871053 RepID=UPI0035B44337